MTDINIKDFNQEINRQINEANGTMVIREAIQNCIEAIGDAQDGKINISAFDITKFINDNTSNFNKKQIDDKVFDDILSFSIQNQNDPNFKPNFKLCIWNNTTGMDSDDLREATDLSSSKGDKNMNINENFGRGIKITGMKANRKGFLWLSCKDEEVNLVWLRKKIDGNGYERVNFYDLDDDTVVPDYDGISDVLDISDFKLPWSKSEDWNAYIFLGNEYNQNTVTHPFSSNKSYPKHWILRSIYTRFLTIPHDIPITLEKGVCKDSNTRFQSFWNRLNDMVEKSDKNSNKYSELYDVEYEVVDDGDINIIYIYDGEYQKTTTCTASNDYVAFSGIIYRNEFYDVASNSKDNATLRARALSIKIPFGYQYVRVFVEIKENDDLYGIDSDRENLFNKNSVDNEKISFDQYKERILNKDNIPDWFIKRIKEHYPDNEFDKNNVKDQIAKIAKYYNFKYIYNKKPRNTKPTTNPDKGRTRGGKSGISIPKIDDIFWIDNVIDLKQCSALSKKDIIASFVNDNLYINCLSKDYTDIINTYYSYYRDKDTNDDLIKYLKCTLNTDISEILAKTVFNAYEKFNNKDDRVKALNELALSNTIDCRHFSYLEDKLEKEYNKLNIINIEDSENEEEMAEEMPEEIE